MITPGQAQDALRLRHRELIDALDALEARVGHARIEIEYALAVPRVPTSAQAHLRNATVALDYALEQSRGVTR